MLISWFRRLLTGHQNPPLPLASFSSFYSVRSLEQIPFAKNTFLHASRSIKSKSWPGNGPVYMFHPVQLNVDL